MILEAKSVDVGDCRVIF